jgi:hypothetical protein
MIDSVAGAPARPIPGGAIAVVAALTAGSGLWVAFDLPTPAASPATPPPARTAA